MEPCSIWCPASTGDAVNADIRRLAPAARSAWIALLKHLLTATSARPSDRWQKTTMKLMEGIGSEIQKSLDRWLPLVAKGRTLWKTPAYVGDTRTAGDTIHEENATVLRG